MPRTKSEQLENQRREQLLVATYSVFAKQGFAATSLADIAAAADFSKAMVIYYFKSKENLLVAAFRMDHLGHLERLDSCCLGSDRAEPMLRAQLEQLFMSTRRNRRFYHVYLDFLAQSVHNVRRAGSPPASMPAASAPGAHHAWAWSRASSGPYAPQRSQLGLRGDDGRPANAMAV